MRRGAWLLGLVVAGAGARGQMAAGADVTLEGHGGKTAFYLGEPVALDLVFTNRTGAPVMLNTVEYGDLSEKVEISPSTGWVQWQTPSGHDYLSQVQLGTAPVRVPVMLDEGYVFREAGEYRVRVTTGRAGGGPVRTNELTLELMAMPAGEEARRVEGLTGESASAGAGSTARGSALKRLATLQGDEALREKIRLLESGDDDFRSVYREAFATTHDLSKQLAMLEDAWTNPKLVPQYDTPDALGETRMLMAGRPLEGWRMTGGGVKADPTAEKIASEGQRDMVALLDSMGQRSGESRTMGAYFLIEFGGLTEAERARAVEYVVEEFPHMDDTAQHMVLETARPPVRDARMVPMLRAMLKANAADKDAAAALLAMVPDETEAAIVQVVCAAKGVVLLDTFKDAKSGRVPAVDGCLGALLRVAPAPATRAEWEWQQRAVEAARFGTAAILPAMREGWTNPRQDSAALAVLLRDDPGAALDLLKREAAAGKLDGMMFYETQEVYRQVGAALPEVVLTWVRGLLATGSNKDAETAGYVLSFGGDASDARRVEARLEELRKGAGMGVGDGPLERDLVGLLVGAESRLRVGEAERGRIRQGCVSEECRVWTR